MKISFPRLGWAVAVCLGCATAAFAQKPAPPPARATPFAARQHKAALPTAQYPEEAAVVERIRANIRYNNDGTSDEVQYVRVRIQAQPAIQAWGQIVVGYNASTDKIHVDFVRVHKPGGRVVTAGPDAVQDLSAPVTRIAPVYTSLRQLHITVPDLGIGDTLEYQITTKTIHPLVPGQFFFEWNFSKHAITLDETLTVNVPDGRKLKVKTANGAASPIVRDEGGRRIYTWHSSFTKRPKDTGDKNAKKRKRPTPKFPDVALSTFDNWAQVGQWYAKLERPRAAVTPPVRTEAAKLVKGQTTDMGKVKAIYDYVAENIRYVSLSFGLGQYQPHPAAEVLANQYGDCKDKATLFEALLAAEGIRSYPVLINAVAKVDPEVPSPGQFDHLINVVKVDGKSYWADTTPGVTPFGFLLPPLRDKWALGIPATKPASLVRTPEHPPFTPLHVFDIDGKIGALGQLQGSFSVLLSGSAGAGFRATLDRLPRNDWPKFAKILVHTMFSKQSTTSDFHFSDPADLNHPFRFHAQFTDPNAVNLTRKNTTLPLPGGGMDLARISRPEAGSKTPLKLGGIQDETMRWKIQLPAQLSASLPVPVHLKRDYAQYDASYSLSGKTLTVVRHLVLLKSKLPPSRYDDYQSFRSSVVADTGQQIGLTNSAPGMGPIPKGMSADDLYQAGLAAQRSGNFDEAAKLLAAVAKKDPDRHDIWNMVGYVNLAARHYHKAVAAFQKQIARNAFDPNAYNYLGDAYTALGRYDDAIREYKKQIQVNPLHRYAHANLAGVYLQQKKYALAAPELQSAIKLNPKDYQLDVNLGGAQLGLHKDAEALQSFQKAMSNSPTPMMWNNIAFTLSQHRAHLQMARQLSENSIRAVEAQLNAISLDTIGAVQAGQVGTISAYWDTMGWILYQQGRTKQAGEYVHAAWMLDDAAAIGDHMGRIYEKEGRRKRAIRAFALALLCPNPPVETRDRLAKLVGKDKVDAEVDSVRAELAARRSVTLPNPDHLNTSAQFWVLLSPGSKASRSKATRARVENVKFISGAAGLRAYGKGLRKARFPYSFPPGEQTKLVLRGKLACSKTSHQCVFTPFSADTAAQMTYASGSSSGQ